MDEIFENIENEEELDELIELLGKEIFEQDEKVAIINLDRVKQVEIIHKLLTKVTSGSISELSCKLHEPLKNVGYIEIVGQNITFDNPLWLVAISKYASNIEVYPRTDGKIQMNLTFYDLTTPIE